MSVCSHCNVFDTVQHFSTREEAVGRSKLARELLKRPEVTGVFFGREFISVNKVEDISWQVGV
jgi:hypothetical protein